MDTGYKIMAMMLEERQAGFRKKEGIDNIFILKTVAKTKINKENGSCFYF